MLIQVLSTKRLRGVLAFMLWVCLRIQRRLSCLMLQLMGREKVPLILIARIVNRKKAQE